MKLIRAGNTELILCYLRYLESLGVDLPNNSYNFWINYLKTSGYFEVGCDFTHVTDSMRDFLDNYASSLQGADLVVMNITYDNLQSINVNFLESFFSNLKLNNLIKRQSVDYKMISDLCSHKKVFLVSPFYPLMSQQWESGNLSHIQPTFKPEEISGYRFPYLFKSTKYDNSNEALKELGSTIAESASCCDVAILSCGAYGASISNEISKSGVSDVFYVGGDMQIFFGIMGGRWRNTVGMSDGYLKNIQYWLSDIPSEYSFPEGKSIENSCYW